MRISGLAVLPLSHLRSVYISAMMGRWHGTNHKTIVWQRSSSNCLAACVLRLALPLMSMLRCRQQRHHYCCHITNAGGRARSKQKHRHKRQAKASNVANDAAEVALACDAMLERRKRISECLLQLVHALAMPVLHALQFQFSHIAANTYITALALQVNERVALSCRQ